MPILKRNQTLGPRLDLRADVLVLGGGPAAAWAAVSAAQAGRRVVLADKGYLGTSGATAPSNTGTWCVPPGESRQKAVDRRWLKTGELGDPRWMLRCVDTAYGRLLDLVEEGYPFPHDDTGEVYVANLRGPDYMRFMRRKVLKAGVTVLDHHPALELLEEDGEVVGAAGLDRQRDRDWRVLAPAVVLATGGCAFFERILGGTGLTGDGYLMAAEAGATLSGMEFTGKYTMAPHGSSLNKGLPFRWCSFEREDGTPLLAPDGEPLRLVGGEGEAAIVRAMIEGPVFACMDQAEPVLQDALRRGQPNCFVPYDRAGIDPFRQRFRVAFRMEGTVRGTGGIRIVDDECSAGVPGLYVAGDAASREAMTGAVSGGGAVNASWAIASGWWAGAGAARHAARRPLSPAAEGRPLGRVGLRPSTEGRRAEAADIVKAVQTQMIPLERNYFRSEATLRERGARLDAAWAEAASLGGEGLSRLRPREAAAALASARWSVAAALARAETRGMQRRTDFPARDEGLRGSILVDGLDAVRVRLPQRSDLRQAS